MAYVFFFVFFFFSLVQLCFAFASSAAATDDEDEHGIWEKRKLLFFCFLNFIHVLEIFARSALILFIS